MTPLAALTVLVADDDPDMRTYLARCLSLFGVGRVLTAADGLEALHVGRTVDLVIADVRMPGLDGEALCRALHVGARGVPVLLISGVPASAYTEADGYLRKPFNARALRAEIGRLVAAAPPPTDVSH